MINEQISLEQVDEMRKNQPRNCHLCRYSHTYGQASCKYKDEPEFREANAQIGNKARRIPCLKAYEDAGLHGWIDPISGEPVIITAQAVRAIQEALDEEEAGE